MADDRQDGQETPKGGGEASAGPPGGDNTVRPDAAAAARSGRRWTRFGRRLAVVLFRPGSFWQGVRDERITVGELMWPHILFLISLRSLAGLVGAILAGASLGSAAAGFVSGFASWLILVWVFALAAGIAATASGGRINAHDPLRYAAYGLAPLFIVGMLGAVPLPFVAPAADLVAMPWTFYVLGRGAIPMLGMRPDRAPGAVGLLCGVLLVLWGVMPTLVPMIVHSMMQ